MVDNMVSMSSPVYIMGSDASRVTEVLGRWGRGGAVFRSHNSAGMASECEPDPEVNSLVSGLPRHTEFFS